MDRLFISDLAADGAGRERQLVRSTVELGHALGLRVVAEGIEDVATLQLVSNWAATWRRATSSANPSRPPELDFHGRLRAGPGRGGLNTAGGAAFYAS